ncbi:MAG: ABC transporter permease [Deltaproteobacteria bacterium]|nr:ABC transporter permease [Deltaproteobacteria bacterium]MBW2122504.1 ABC transporter permease [Deltaproteobacteria bacterium]
MSRLRHMVRKEFIQAFRDKRSRILLFLPPVMQLFLFGYAVNMDITNVRLGVVDLSHSQQSRALIESFDGSRYFRVIRVVENQHEIGDLLDHGTVHAVLVVGRDFAKKIKREENNTVQLILDGSDSNTATLIGQYATSIVLRYSRSLLTAWLDHQVSLQLLKGKAEELGRIGDVSLRERAWYNPNLKSRFFFVPGVIAMIVMLVITLLTAMAIVREKEIGTLEQLMVSPIRPWELIVGKSIPFILVGYADMILVTVMAAYWFRVPIRGNLALLFLSTSVYLLSALGTGLFISTISQTQQQAMMTNFFFFSPMVLLSGFVFPIANMPKAVQFITFANPMRYFLVIIRGIFLKGIGTDVLWPHLFALGVIGLTLLTISTVRFRKRID